MSKRVAAALTAAVWASGCSIGTDGNLADAADTAFLQAVAAKQYQQAYQSAAPELQNAMDAETFQGMLQRVDRKLGPCGPARKTFDMHVNMTLGQYTRTQGYTRTCKNGQLGERLTVIIRGGQAKVAGFYVSSPLLLTD